MFVVYLLLKLIHNTLQISRNTYFKTLKKLKEINIIITNQLHINDRFAYCNYYINGKETNKIKTRFIFKGLKSKTNITTKKQIILLKLIM